MNPDRAEQIAEARRLLTENERAPSALAMLAAAALAAVAAVLMAGVMVLGPGVNFDPPAASTAP